ncbi:MAG: tRNA 4-thiouridine(8) synthase ThiI [Acholeplasmataceae bacterium]|nr:tRNA 4-thiouridine(8) synthase ThiI [Acholeplasmataceae bacterium]
MYDLILVRYGEMTLKKKNYQQFLKQINLNLRNKLRQFSKLTFSGTNYRFYIYLNGEDYRKVIEVLDTVMGLYSYSLCVQTKPIYEDMAKAGVLLLEREEARENSSFKVETHRADKSFPATSIEISQEVAKRILPQVPGLKVDVHDPDYTVAIDLRNEGTYVFVKTILGMGGYPSGVAGKGLLMVSGGIDSPIAGFLSLRKGIHLTALHFASPPYTSDMALQKVIDLLQVLANYTPDGKIKLLVVPFTKIQTAIHQHADSIYLVTLMRRQMYKIAARLCAKNQYDVIINGESIGQVASQTLESIAVVNEVTNIPIIRPLATYDKEQIINIARRIKTYDISVRPYEDCCTVFVPEHPIIKPRLDRVLNEENKCNLDGLLEEAIAGIEEISLNNIEKKSVLSKFGNFEI